MYQRTIAVNSLPLGWVVIDMEEEQTLRIDCALVEYINEDWKKVQKEIQDGRERYKYKVKYDCWILLWNYLSCSHKEDVKRAGFGRNEYAKVPKRFICKGLGITTDYFAALKREVAQLGWAEYYNKDFEQHKMKPIYSGEKKEIKLFTRRKINCLIPNHTDDEKVCRITRASMDALTVDMKSALEFLQQKEDDERRYEAELEGINEEGLPIFADDHKLHKERERQSRAEYHLWYCKRERNNRDRHESTLRQIGNNVGAVTRDEFGNRLHSPMARMRRELREFLKINNEKLFCIDIRESHPTIIGNWMRKEGLDDGGLLADAKNRKFYKTIGEMLMEDKPYKEAYKYYKDIDPEEERLGARGRAKIAAQVYLNGALVTGRTLNKERKAVDKIMKEVYPEAWRFVAEEKKGLRSRRTPEEVEGRVSEGKLFNKRLQRFESHLFVDRYYMAMAGRYGVNSFTIHDALYGPISAKELAVNTMKKICADEGFDCEIEVEAL